MALNSNRQAKRKRKKEKSQEQVKPKRKLVSSKIYHGIKFQKTPKIDFIRTTNLTSRPNVIFNMDDMRTIMLDYSSSNEDNLEVLNQFFSGLTSKKSTVQIKKGTAEYVDELKTQKTSTLETTYTFIKFVDNNKIILRANSDIEVLDELFLGKYFIKTPQMIIEEKPKTKRTVSRLINYTNDPSLSDLNLSVGDVLVITGSNHNDMEVTVLSDVIIKDTDGREHVDISKVNLDEVCIGSSLKIEVYKVTGRKQAERSSSTSPIEATNTPQINNINNTTRSCRHS